MPPAVGKALTKCRIMSIRKSVATSPMKADEAKGALQKVTVVVQTHTSALETRSIK